MYIYIILCTSPLPGNMYSHRSGAFSQRPSMATFHPWTPFWCCGTELIPENLNGFSKIALVMSRGSSAPIQTSSCLWWNRGYPTEHVAWFWEDSPSEKLEYSHSMMYTYPSCLLATSLSNRHVPWSLKNQQMRHSVSACTSQRLRTPLNRVRTLNFTPITQTLRCTLEPGPHLQSQQSPCFPLRRIALTWDKM